MADICQEVPAATHLETFLHGLGTTCEYSALCSLCLQNVEVLASRSNSSEQSQAEADLREKVLREENEKLQGRIAELERRVAQLQRQMEDVKGDEAQAKETLRKCEVRQGRGLAALLPSFLKVISEVGKALSEFT